MSKRYGRTIALDSVSLEVQPNELFALLGPNGAGKTTLVHILCTIHPPDAGLVRVGGVDVLRRPRQARSSIGVVFQEPSLDDRLTASENLEFHGLIYGVPAAQRRQRINTLLELVELADRRHDLVRSFSVGMKRRLEIARALVHDARLLFLDEPTVGLDAQTRARIWEYLRALQRERELTILVTTHYIDEVEACNRVCIIDHGRVLALDSPQHLKEVHGEEYVRVRAREAEVTTAILDQYGDKATLRDDEVLLRSDGPPIAEELFLRYGSKLRSVTVDSPSLETVFLSLTGREIRDGPATSRDHLRAFGRRGGEHTR